MKEIAVKEFSKEALSDLLHGYLCVYSQVRVYPWLEEEFDNLWDIHERVRGIAREIQLLLKNHDLPVDERAGYVVDLMDAYLLYSDLNFLEVALDAAYEILVPQGSHKMVLPCRTPNICRMLCNCYYLTGEEECGLLAGCLVTEALGFAHKTNQGELTKWWEVLQFYGNVVGGMELSETEREQLVEEQARLRISVVQMEDEKIKYFRKAGHDVDTCLLAEVFVSLARREFFG